jgi:hypothetical protein
MLKFAPRPRIAALGRVPATRTTFARKIVAFFFPPLLTAVGAGYSDDIVLLQTSVASGRVASKLCALGFSQQGVRTFAVFFAFSPGYFCAPTARGRGYKRRLESAERGAVSRASNPCEGVVIVATKSWPPKKKSSVSGNSSARRTSPKTAEFPGADHFPDKKSHRENTSQDATTGRRPLLCAGILPTGSANFRSLFRLSPRVFLRPYCERPRLQKAT